MCVAWGFRRLVVVAAAVVASALVLLPSGEPENPGPWDLTVAGRDTGVVAVAALDPHLNGPVVEWMSRAATRADVSFALPPTDQQRSRAEAWRGSLSVLHRQAPDLYGMNGRAPVMDVPDAWFGRSTSLAYALAFLDSTPLNPTAGSLLHGRKVAATGFLDSDGTLHPVGYVEVKYAAAREAGADILIVPKAAWEQAVGEGFIPQATGPTVVPVATLLEAVTYLCDAGGTGKPCQAAERERSTWWKSLSSK